MLTVVAIVWGVSAVISWWLLWSGNKRYGLKWDWLDTSFLLVFVILGPAGAIQGLIKRMEGRI